ncbi:methyltransferase domain-containing protein [Nocardia panacis]|uniref:Methyltransferase domain-containing protein n=1 Tax=Nocardia panacis TaxID=2340916 RepID=A0A3A4KDT8_9NOCA|nr:methyltransferase domain-containing protein [Nocardia panacis]RJO80368.1 methyltransferase domain-containing protein [Nocardia panacis]
MTTADTSALVAAAGLLACPECGSEFEVPTGVLRCARGHSFDIARQGYVSLLTGASTKMSGDTAAMLEARAAFQGAGHFAPIAAAVARTHPSGPVLEVGAGTGYYLAQALDAAPDADGLAIDVAKPAARRAARAHPRAASVLADAWRGLPIRDGSIGTVLSVFAPRNPAEVARVLTPGGQFVVVVPTPRHLGELIGPLDLVTVDPAKERRLDAALADRFAVVERETVEYSMSLDRVAVGQVVAMGPSAFHAARSTEAALAALPDQMPVTASVTVATYRTRPA